MLGERGCVAAAVVAAASAAVCACLFTHTGAIESNDEVSDIYNLIHVVYVSEHHNLNSSREWNGMRTGTEKKQIQYGHLTNVSKCTQTENI